MTGIIRDLEFLIRCQIFSWSGLVQFLNIFLLLVFVGKSLQRKGCVISMVVVSLLPHAEFGRNGHRDDASHFTIIGRLQEEK